MLARTILFLIVLSATTLASSAQQSGARVSNRDLTNLVIVLRRDPCLGKCPVYSVTVRGNGRVTYKGWKFVNVRGEKHYQIPKERVAELVEAFYQIDYFSLLDEYRSITGPDGSVTVAMDLPGVLTSIKIDGKRKSVYNYFGGPTALKDLERKIDEISGVSRFVDRS
jgi:hypothetical protein